jgi:uncharacterized membrane protein
MTHDWILYAIVALALWTAVIGGVFLAFSEFIMAALKRARPSSGIEAMQAINRTVIPTQFVLGIVVIPILSMALAGYATTILQGAVVGMLYIAALVFGSSVFLVTVAGNVPMNNQLAGFDKTSEEADAYWKVYLRQWTRLNHYRSAGAIVTAGLYIIAALVLVTSGQV